jgi:hypothetical protein
VIYYFVIITSIMMPRDNPDETNRPCLRIGCHTYNHFFLWMKKALPGGTLFMFGLAVVCSAIWKARNRACFDKEPIKHPSEIFYSNCFFLRYWAGLRAGEAHQKIQDGVGQRCRQLTRSLRRSLRRGRFCC